MENIVSSIIGNVIAFLLFDLMPKDGIECLNWGEGQRWRRGRVWEGEEMVKV